MKLRRQLYISFLVVAILPLLIVFTYLFQTTVKLAFDLYKQNLYNSAEIQTNIIDDHIRQFMIQANRFGSSKPVVDYMSSLGEDSSNFIEYEGVSDEVLKFIDNTLDSSISFALIDNHKRIIYISGSNDDNLLLENLLENLPTTEKQNVLEVPWNKEADSLIISTPVKSNSSTDPLGMLVIVYSNDYFLKTISSHRQIEATNSFIYCIEHKRPVKSKNKIYDSLADLSREVDGNESGSMTCFIDGEESLASYNQISQTPWILVNSIPVKHIYLLIFSHGFFSIFIFTLSIIAIMVLSRKQSKYILVPFNNLLKNVEDFFISGAKVFPPMKMDKKNEVGYLADKFNSMAVDIAIAQSNRNECHYLYEALLHATYDLTISIDYKKCIVTSSSFDLSNEFKKLSDKSIAEQLLSYFQTRVTSHALLTIESLQIIADRKIKKPLEFETCCNMGEYDQECWYRIIAVPIVSESHQVVKTVLHFEDITAQKLEELRLLESSQKDPLCGLLNKQAFLILAQKYCTGNKIKNVVFFIDLDNFKQVNDSLGHATGDHVLIRTSEILTNEFRPTDLVARYGGDEFVIFIPGMSRAIAEKKASRLLSKLGLTLDVPNGDIIHVSASIGIYFTTCEENPSDMVDQADKAMYQAKRNGKSQYKVIGNWEV